MTENSLFDYMMNEDSSLNSIKEGSNNALSGNYLELESNSNSIQNAYTSECNLEVKRNRTLSQSKLQELSGRKVFRDEDHY